MPFDSFKVIINSLTDSPLKEIHFSGGEPFTNPDTIKMIQYANDYTVWDIGCATNTSLLSEDTITQLSKTRVKLNIQFPSIRQDEFSDITRNGDWGVLCNKLNLLKQYNIPFGLNHVLTEQNITQVRSVIDYAQSNGFSIKLLPDINVPQFVQYKDGIFSFLDNIAETRINKGTGAIKWKVKTLKGTHIQVMYIDHPCYSKNIGVCKSFAEIRLLPNLTLQPCIKKATSVQLDSPVKIGDENSIKLKFQEVWENFISC
jgi:cyclic pyranopterin phosphate synthase